MKIDQLDWVTGLDESGWIAAILFVVFFIITVITVVMMLRLRQSNKNQQRTSIRQGQEPPVSKPLAPGPDKAAVNQTKAKDEDSNPIEEAKVFLTYGLNKQAVDLLEKHLHHNPSDTKARKLLIKAQSGK